jgi:hypothetical protein
MERSVRVIKFQASAFRHFSEGNLYQQLEELLGTSSKASRLPLAGPAGKGLLFGMGIVPSASRAFRGKSKKEEERDQYPESGERRSDGSVSKQTVRQSISKERAIESCKTTSSCPPRIITVISRLSEASERGVAACVRVLRVAHSLGRLLTLAMTMTPTSKGAREGNPISWAHGFMGLQ